MIEIADASEVSRATLYNHYRDKSAVISALITAEVEYMIELANKVISATSSSSKIKFEHLPLDDPKQRKPDISNAEKLLGWTPKVELDVGINQTVNYFSSLINGN